jgi:hypothetical protein
LGLIQFLIQQRQVRTQDVLWLLVVVMVDVFNKMAAPAVLVVVAAMTFNQAVQELQDKAMLAVNHLALDILLVRVVAVLELLV